MSDIKKRTNNSELLFFILIFLLLFYDSSAIAALNMMLKMTTQYCSLSWYSSSFFIAEKISLPSSFV